MNFHDNSKNKNRKNLFFIQFKYERILELRGSCPYYEKSMIESHIIEGEVGCEGGPWLHSNSYKFNNSYKILLLIIIFTLSPPP